MDRSATLLDAASRHTGLQDFGEDSFREGLHILVASLDRDARLTAFGSASLDGQIVHFLSCRLQVEDWYRRHPEIEDQEITSPVIGLGLPRTGSTAFGCLLGEDPGVRVIRTWEAAQPCPPPESATEHTDPRIADTAANLALQDRLYPRMKSMLPLDAQAPTECQSFMGYDFKSQIFMATAYLPSYVAWLNHTADLVPTYRYVKRVLKLLQWRCPPRRWRLKNPSNSLFIDALDTVFPDARFWMTHRDITKVVPSVCDLFWEMARPYSEAVDTIAIGRQNTEFTELGQRRVIAFRDARGHNSRFFDLQFDDMQRDPLGQITSLYDWLGEKLSDTAQRRMQEWWGNSRREHPPEQGGGAPDFGLDPAVLRERFRFYTDRYQVRLTPDRPVSAR